MNLTNQRGRLFTGAEFLLIVAVSIVPLFITPPYRINIFLSWDGAFRIYEGQIPYKDFGLPMGFGYWLIPALFFTLFGPAFASLIKAQVFINIISGLAFRGILTQFEVAPAKRFLSLLVYSLTFIFGNIWPWYNHTVIVYELIGIYFLLKYIFDTSSRFRLIYLFISALFIFLSFFTKQDAGVLAILLALSLTIYASIIEKSIKPTVLFLLLLSIVACVFIVPFLKYDFLYWFNLGQAPHNARISMHDFASIILGESRWEKLYLFVITLVALIKFKKPREFFFDKREFLFFLLTLGLLAEAFVFQVTSYVPKNNNIFFHAFCFSFILASMDTDYFGKKSIVFIILLASVSFLWSESYWKYVDRSLISKPTESSKGVGITSFILPIPSDTLRYSDASTWVLSETKAFKGILMPKSTVNGIQQILNMGIVREKGNKLKVLNMTELTPLALEMGYPLTKNKPMWYHLGVGMFEKEKDQFCKEIENGEYDLVLFEDIPALNNFYPFEIKECLKKTYILQNSFKAPRSDLQGTIEVYSLKK
jgi:hypothetical protein